MERERGREGDSEGRMRGVYFSSHAAMLESDPPDSSTIKITHFKEDEAGALEGAEGQGGGTLHLHPLPPFFSALRRLKERRRSEGKLKGRAGVISRLRHTKRVNECVRVSIGVLALQVFD